MPVEVIPVFLAVVFVKVFCSGHAVVLLALGVGEWTQAPANSGSACLRGGPRTRGHGDSPFRARADGFGDLRLLIGRDIFVDDRRVTVDLIELEYLRSDHGAERVTLASLRVDLHLHGCFLSGDRFAGGLAGGQPAVAGRLRRGSRAT
jgi:hypothetical protein